MLAQEFAVGWGGSLPLGERLTRATLRASKWGFQTLWERFRNIRVLYVEHGPVSNSVLVGFCLCVQVAFILESNGVVHFPDPYMQGFGWDKRGMSRAQAWMGKLTRPHGMR